jgi:hypothetical protein
MLRGAPVVESRVMRVSAEALHQNRHFPFTRRTTPVSQLASQSLNVINKALLNQLVVALRLFHFFALRLISNTSQKERNLRAVQQDDEIALLRGPGTQSIQPAIENEAAPFNARRQARALEPLIGFGAVVITCRRRTQDVLLRSRDVAVVSLNMEPQPLFVFELTLGRMRPLIKVVDSLEEPDPV